MPINKNMENLCFCILIISMIMFVRSEANEYDVAARTRNFNREIKADGSYLYQYDTTNGIAAQESGLAGYYASGSSVYYTPDGQLINLSYTADENGFHPSGDHLPTPPPTPLAILKSLEYIRTHPIESQEEQQSQSPAQKQEQNIERSETQAFQTKSQQSQQQQEQQQIYLQQFQQQQKQHLQQFHKNYVHNRQ